MRSMLTVLFICGVVAAASRAEKAPEPLPTTDELHQLYKDHDYTTLLQKLNRVLQLHGDAARPYDFIELNLLKIDAHLQLKELSLASSAATAAVRLIDEDRTPPREAAVARATALMLQRSRAWAYTPRVYPAGHAPQPLSIVDADKRTAVFTAMFDDAKGGILAKVHAGKQSRTLGPIIDAVRAVSEMRTLELAASGKDEQSAAQLNDLAAAAHDVMAKAVKDMGDREESIKAHANELLEVPNIAASPYQNNPGLNQTGFASADLYRKRGLSVQETQELRGIVGTSDQVKVVARQFAQVSKEAAPALKELQDAADRLGLAAKATLEDDYTGAFTK
jgi:hypothetical protein